MKNYPTLGYHFLKMAGLVIISFSLSSFNLNTGLEELATARFANPQIVAQSFKITEGSSSGTSVGIVMASDDGTIVNYTIIQASFLKSSNPPPSDSDQDPAYNAMQVFQINADTGEISVNNPKYLLSGLGPVELIVKVQDNDGDTSQATITIEVEDIEVTISQTYSINWQKRKDHPNGHAEATGGTAGGKLYVFGGFGPNYAPKADVHVYDPSNNTWTQLTNMPPMATNSGAGGATHMGWTTDGTDIYIAAGYAANTKGTGQQFGSTRVYRYNVASNDYTELPQFPVERAAGELDFINGKLYFVAGTNRPRNEDQGDLLILDLSNLQAGWTYGSPMPNPRNHLGTAVIDSKLYVLGGQKEHDDELVPQDDVHRYDPVTDEWTHVTDMPQPFNHIHSSVFPYGDYIFTVCGQINHGGGSHNEVYAYNTVTNKWAQFTNYPSKRFSVVADVINGRLFASGGNGAKGTFAAFLPEQLLKTEIVENKSDLKFFKLFPNPVEQQLNIAIEKSAHAKKLEIVDISGCLLQTYTLKEGNQNFVISVENLPQGLYIFRLKTDKGNTTQKFIKI
ncbi:MAG: kelch repeat-containing protein [Leeuwenhoekiella sp.]